MSFNKVVEGIKDVKIQGAENIAVNAALSLRFIKGRTRKDYLSALGNARGVLFETRPTEPMMRNTINFILSGLQGTKKEMEGQVRLRIKEALNHINTANNLIAGIGAGKIKKGGVVYTHCHSSTVIGILKKAKQQGKRFSVNNTETRPLYEGRITAKELVKLNIPVKHFVDSAARIALKEADIMLIGCDAIDLRGKIYNKIGSELIAEAAYKLNVPVYVCTDSWKFDRKAVSEEIEMRKGREIWRAPKKIKLVNYAFEKINPLLVAGIISELGIHKPKRFIQEFKRVYPYI